MQELPKLAVGEQACLLYLSREYPKPQLTLFRFGMVNSQETQQWPNQADESSFADLQGQVLGSPVEGVRARLAGRRTYGRIITSLGPEGSRKFTPRSWFSFKVAGTSKLEISIFLVHAPVIQ